MSNSRQPTRNRPPQGVRTARILGLESTCDETAAAILEFAPGTTEPRVLGETIASQVALHAAYRGVAPEAAARAHTEAISGVIANTLHQAALEPTALTGIAVSRSPGLVGCLLVGVSAAKMLSWRLGIPWVGVDHIHSHIHSAYLAGMPDEPHLALVASGGHTALYRVTARDQEPHLLGSTIDDAVGEAFDKVAALLGLPYPGGPAIQEAAVEGNPRAYDFPRSKLHDADDDFSFSGLKTAVLYRLRGGQGPAGPAATVGVGRELSTAEVADCAASFQEAACEVLVRKTLRACEREGLRRVSVGGGVACNRRLREMFQERAAAVKVTVSIPAPRYCTDNAVMVAALGAVRLIAGEGDPYDREIDPTPLRRR